MKKFLGLWDVKVLLKEKDPKKRQEIADRIVEEIGCQIGQVSRVEGSKQEAASSKEHRVYKIGDCSRLAERCADCVVWARLTGMGFCGLLSAHRYGPYVCGECRKGRESAL